MGWLDGKGVCIHSKGQGIKLHVCGVVSSQQWYINRIFYYINCRILA